MTKTAIVGAKICLFCGNSYFHKKNEYGKNWAKRKYCSPKCSYLAKRKDVLFTCEECGFDIYRRSKEKNKRFCSRKCMFLWRSREIKKGNISLKNINKFGKKEENPNWKGGVTSANEEIRKSKEYRFWRNAVFKRDKYICRWCNQRGGELNADHIKPFALYPKSRFVIDNGRTLCKNCHRKTFIFYKNQYVRNSNYR